MVVAPEQLAETDMLAIKVHESPGDLSVRIVICNNNMPFSGIIQPELFVGKENTPSFDFAIYRPKYGLVVCMSRGGHSGKDDQSRKKVEKFP